MKLIYIAGPMRGKPFYNFHKFMLAEEWLMRADFLVVNPARFDIANGFDPRELPDDSDWDKFPSGLNRRQVISRDIQALLKCDGVATLEGWTESSGATAEVAVAEFADMPVKTVDQWAEEAEN